MGTILTPVTALAALPVALIAIASTAATWAVAAVPVLTLRTAFAGLILAVSPALTVSPVFAVLPATMRTVRGGSWLGLRGLGLGRSRIGCRRRLGGRTSRPALCTLAVVMMTASATALTLTSFRPIFAAVPARAPNIFKFLFLWLCRSRFGCGSRRFL